MLCDHAVNAMIQHAEGTTSDEIISAMLTMGLRAVQYAVKHNAKLESLRDAVAKIYAEFPAEKVN